MKRKVGSKHFGHVNLKGLHLCKKCAETETSGLQLLKAGFIVWTTTLSPLALLRHLWVGQKKKPTCWNNAEVFSSKFCFEFYARYPIHYLPVLTSCWLPCNDFLGAEATGTQRFDELWPTAASVAASLQVQALIYVFQMSVITLSARWLTQRLLSINRNLLSLPFQTFQLPKAIKHLPTAAKQK